ncbi:MAG: ABC transporter ATP-binding protein [Flavobacteriales bacterium]|nr:ABC transporter ATP-binding protein [Flavobacteriales bacterium]
MSVPLVIQAQDVRKMYRLGQTGGATLSEDLHAWLARLLGKPDPLAKLGTLDGQRKGSEFWALQGVSFEVAQGEVVGIVGKNGAGKSTLLKLLSRITLPSEGTIRLKGRMSSLLEVGTGFNPELTGRENIYLNGAILGMKKAEINRKLEEIIGFSGIQHHIDSPVKRYSSGMKVRLGFAVAAHLEPDILVIDEVLAVGDAEFQRKCLGKMKDVARSQRTILFVSHNMTAIQSLCQRVIWLHEGKVRMDGPANDVVRAYLSTYTTPADHRSWDPSEAPGNADVRIREIRLERNGTDDLITWHDTFRIVIGFENRGIDDGDLNFNFELYNENDALVLISGWREHAVSNPPFARGSHEVACSVPGELLNTGDYRIVVNCFRAGRHLFSVQESIAFVIQESRRTGSWYGKRAGSVRPRLDWELRQGASKEGGDAHQEGV